MKMFSAPKKKNKVLAPVNNEIENFYAKMYTSKISGNNTSDLFEHNHNIHKFIEGLNIPQLNVEEQESLEKIWRSRN